MNKVSDVSSKILDWRSRMNSGVLETRAMLDEYVQARVGEIGRQRAVANLANALRWSPRRVLALLHGEVRRVWFDEVEAARRWHAAWCEDESRRLEAKLALMQARREARQEGSHDGVVARDGVPVGDLAGERAGARHRPCGSQAEEAQGAAGSVSAEVATPAVACGGAVGRGRGK